MPKQLQDVFLSRLSGVVLNAERTEANKVEIAKRDNRLRLDRVIKALPGTEARSPSISDSEMSSHVSGTIEKAKLLHEGLVRRRSQKLDFRFGRLGRSAVEAVRTKRREREQLEHRTKLEKIATKERRRSELSRCRSLLEPFACVRFALALCAVFSDERYARRREARVSAAQTRIARWYKRQQITERFRVVTALAKIQSLAFGVKMHLRRRRTAVRRIRYFFSETKRIHQVMVAKRKICRGIRVLQRAVRDFRACNAARRKALLALWNLAVDDLSVSSERTADDATIMTHSRSGPTLARKMNPDMTAVVDDEQPSVSVVRRPGATAAKVRHLEWQARRKRLQLVAQDKLYRKQIAEFEELTNRAWNRIDTRLDEVRTKLAERNVVKYKKVKKASVRRAVALVPTEVRDALLADLLVRIRRGHQNRWAKEAKRIRYREASKKFTVSEVKTILRMKYPETAPIPVPPQDRRVKEWPVLPFFLTLEDFPGSSAAPHQRLRDIVAIMYRSAVEEVEGTATHVVSPKHRRRSL